MTSQLQEDIHQSQVEKERSVGEYKGQLARTHKELVDTRKEVEASIRARQSLGG